jgi:nucleoid-associated protein YgaU
MGLFEQIKSAFSKTDEPTVEKDVKPEPPPQATAAETPEPAAGAVNSYTVQSGDTLWKIAEEQLGNGGRYKEIFEANRDLLDSPDHILPGQELKIP